MVGESQLGAPANRQYDLIVIGGGVLGIMVTLEATRRGLRPMLLERGAFGAATSASSLRIVHGGLRYLQTLNVARHRQSAAERRWFLDTFPDLVRPLLCLMPLYGMGAQRPAPFRVAFALDRLLLMGLSRRVPEDRHLPRSRVLSPPETHDLFPKVEGEGLMGAALWHDGFVKDTARLYEVVLAWARAAGAAACEHVEVLSPLMEAGRIAGVRAKDLRGDREVKCRSPLVINAAGPWAPGLARAFGASAGEPGKFLLAWNLIIDRQPLASCALALRARKPGSQTYFMVPWEDRILAGTGYVPWKGGLENLELPKETLDAFIIELNAALPALGLERSQVSGVMTGLLPANPAKPQVPAELDVILDHGRLDGPQGFFSAIGVKLTTARALADQILNLALPRRRPLPYAEFPRPTEAARAPQS